MRPTILLIADFSFFGGTRTYFNQLLELYKELGYDVFVAVDPQNTRNTDFVFEENRVIYLPEQVYETNPGFFQKIFVFFGFIWTIISVFKRVRSEIRKRKIDLMVVSTGCCDRYLSLFALPAPCLYFNHTTPQKGFLDRFHRFILKRTLGPDKRIIAGSEFTRMVIIKIWGTDSITPFIQTIYYGSKPSGHLPHNENNEERKKPGRTILTVGHVNWYKNPDMWIQVAETVSNNPAFQDCSWVWAGDGEMLEHCRTVVEKKGLKNVSFIGYCSDIIGLYQEAAVYFQPSIHENCSLAVLDALKTGVPCVVTRIGGLPEQVIDGVTGFTVENGDVQAAAEKISWLLNHREEREEMGRAGYNRYKQIFSEENWKRQMQQLHEEILQRQHQIA